LGTVQLERQAYAQGLLIMALASCKKSKVQQCSNGWQARKTCRSYKQTVGLDTYSKQLNIRGQDIILSVWDIGGQAVNSKMLTKYIAGADIAFICFDLTDHASYADLEAWNRKIGAACTMASAQPPIKYLLGNKADLIGQRTITAQQVSSASTELKCKGHFEVSAESGDDVPRAFYTAAGIALGMELTAHELEFHATVVGASVCRGGSEEARVEGAEDIEAEDAAAEASKEQCLCTMM
jgi:GTPase SAR1 family protein